MISGKSLGQFLKDEIFDPLGMNNTGYRYRGDIKSRMASMYQRIDTGKLEKIEGILDEYHQPDAIYESGGAGLYSTVKEYLTFSQMMSNGGTVNGVNLLGRKTIDLMRTNHLNTAQLSDFTNSYHTGYGYGLGVRTLMDKAAGHGREWQAPGFYRSERTVLRRIYASARSQYGRVPSFESSRSSL